MREVSPAGLAIVGIFLACYCFFKGVFAFVTGKSSAGFMRVADLTPATGPDAIRAGWLWIGAGLALLGGVWWGWRYIHDD